MASKVGFRTGTRLITRLQKLSENRQEKGEETPAAQGKIGPTQVLHSQSGSQRR